MEMSTPEVYTLISPPITELEVHFWFSSEQQGPGKGWGAALSTTVKNSQWQLLIFLGTSFTTHDREVAELWIESLGSLGDRN